VPEIKTCRGPAPYAEQWALVERAQRGDNQAFGELYATYNSEIFRYLRQRCGHQQLAQDLAGDVWERALRGIGRLHQRGGPPLAWLMTIARNRVIDHFRSGRVHREVLIDVTDDMGEAEGSVDIEQVATARLEAAIVLRGMKTLSEPQQEAVVLTYFGGLTSPQAARHMGISEDAVKALNLRARRALARWLTVGPHGRVR
jgi:RNA polymerase sigma-70 factor (ECF subfamily)